MTTKREYEDRFRMFERLRELGITSDHCDQLRRISMTLRRWHEMECGDGNGHVERDEATDVPYWHNANSRYVGANDPRSRSRIADREKGAQKRLAAIMANYPTLSVYIQGDPRGAALYVLKPGDIPADGTADQYYTRGICVY